MPNRSGSFRLFHFAGIDVFLHWSWFIVAVIEVSARTKNYTSPVWNLLEYLALFMIVLLHEFGHALACRQVGGAANQIVLWPLGGVAYVDPPQRPGAMLWSIAAGPLVNVLLLPLLTVIVFVSRSDGGSDTAPNVHHFFITIWFINIALLLFNLLPVYPLDGGQILRSLLWFAMGKARSLLVASIIGFVGVAAVVGWAVWAQSVWLGIMAAFIFINCFRGLNQARALAKLDKCPRRGGYACPSCNTPPPIGPFWVCGQCNHGFDTFLSDASCPHCHARYDTTRCPNCGRSNPLGDWQVVSVKTS